MPRDRSLARVRALGRHRSERETQGLFLVEGPTLVGDALDAGVALVEVVAEPGAPPGLLERAAAAGVPIHAVPQGALRRSLPTVNPPGVVALAGIADTDLEQVLPPVAPAGVLLVLVGLNDPGNAGTLVRSAEAAGVGAVLFCDDLGAPDGGVDRLGEDAAHAVDPFNPKVVRASAGSLFRVPVVRKGNPVDVLERVAAAGYWRVGAVPRGGIPYTEATLTPPAAIVLGSEAHGLPAGIGGLVDQRATIPMAGRAESLNVAMAGTLLCFEAARQRQGERGEVEPST